MKHAAIILLFLLCSCSTAHGAEPSVGTTSTSFDDYKFKIAPRSRPTITLERARALIPNELLHAELVVIAVPDYYAVEMGNGRGVYTAAFFVVGKDFVKGFRGNTKPGAYGWSELFDKYYPSLLPGIVHYEVGFYTSVIDGKSRKALINGKTTVRRDNGREETGYYGIHTHSGSYESVSSAGCQTVFPDDFEEFMRCFEVRNIKKVPYVLLPEHNAAAK